MTIYCAMNQFVLWTEDKNEEGLRFLAEKAAKQNGVNLTQFEIVHRVGIRGDHIKLARVEFAADDSSVSTVVKL